MSDIHFEPSNLCFYDFEDNNMMTPSTPENSHVPFQPWLSSLDTSTTDQSTPLTFWSTAANYTSGYNSQQLTYDHYLPPFNPNMFTSVIPEIDDSMTFDQTRPSSVLSSASSVSTSSTITTVSNPALDIVSGTEATEAVKSKPVSHQSKRKPKSENYRRYPKPPYSYCALIITSIHNSPNQKLTLSGILSKLMELFEFFRGSYQGWRDCIRHNLSHNSCFYRVPYPLPGEDEITGRKSKGRSYWMVDLSRVPSHVFKILDKKAEKSGEYKSYIHEELGLPEIVLPLQYATVDGTPLSMVDTKTQSTIVDDKFIQQSATRHGYRMRLPDVSSCPVANDSPEQFRRRDLNESVTPLTNIDSDTTPTSKRRKLNETCDNVRTENSGEFEQQLLWDYVKSITTSVTSSTDAVNNLSGLC